MKKLAIVLTTLVVLAGVLAYALAGVPALAKAAIEDYAPLYLGVPVSIGEIDWAGGFGGVVIRDFTLGNPPGFKGPAAVYIEHIHIDLDLGRTSLDTVWIERIEIDAVDVAVEVRNPTDTNIRAIVDHAERAMGDQPGDGATTDAEPAADGTRVVIERLDITNVSASLSSPLIDIAAIDVPDVQLQGIDQDDVGSAVADAAVRALGPMTEATMRGLAEEELDVEAAKQKLDLVRDELEEAGKKLLNELFKR